MAIDILSSTLICNIVSASDMCNNASSCVSDSGTIWGTVVSGVVVFVLCECLKELWLEPLQRYKQIKEKVSYALTYYAYYYGNVIDQDNSSENAISAYKDASYEIRKLASELRAFVKTLSWFKLFIPSKKSLYEASSQLIGLSNVFFAPYNTKREIDVIDKNLERAEDIRKKLKLYTNEVSK